MGQTDYYQILAVDKKASQKDIKQAYRKLAFQYHPDMNKDNPAASAKMKEINEAYATLSSPAKRREYDDLRAMYGDRAYEHYRQAHSAEDIFRGSDINSIFDELARTYGFRSPDEVFRQFYGSGYQTFEFHRTGFFGKGFIFHGSQNRQQQRGKDQKNYIKPGELPYANFPGITGKIVKYFFKKSLGINYPERGDDRNDVLPLTPEQAATGGEIAYSQKNLDKPRKFMVRIPSGIKHGQRIKLKGLGTLGKAGGEPGDLFLKVRIRIPLIKRMKDLFTAST